jgi:alkaline phosphatase D
VGLTRRAFLQAAAAAGVAVPLAGACRSGWPPAAAQGASPFRHGVASGDPLADRVILWTRVTPEPGRSRPVALEWRVARDPELRDVVAAGRAVTDAARDWTVKVDAAGLAPGGAWHYGFAAAGHASPVGRTRTLPGGDTERLRLAFASCANYPAGHFTAYGHIARRELDLVLHLGDYLYEYANGTYGDGTALGRVPQPDRELVTLADYRTRHALYKADPDLQAAHAAHPWLVVWDDHELADNAWRDGAGNHDPEREGSWAERRAGAVRAWFEWMPVRESPGQPGRVWRSFALGDLADLWMLDTRLWGRDRAAARTEDVAAGRSLLGAEQEAWLLDGLVASKRAGPRWRVLGQQVMLSQLRNEAGRLLNTDQWDGYPASRARLLAHLRENQIADVVVLTGDVHSSWALEVAEDPFDRRRYDAATGRGALAVELVTPGISSPSPVAPERAETRARDALARHPHLRWLDLRERGYAVLELDRERARAEWWFVESVLEPGAGERLGAAFETRRGTSHLVAGKRPQ